jgi:LemA protein
VTELRESCLKTPDGTAAHAGVEGQLATALQSLMVRLEAYPDLKADRNFLDLQQELTNTEYRIQAALRFYNANVRENNVKVEMLPSSIVAGISKIGKREYFEIQGTDFRQTPQVSF